MAKPAGSYKICDVYLNAKEHWSEWWTFYRSLTSSVHPSEKPWPVVLRGGGYNLVRGQHINLVAIWNALRCTNSFTFLCGPLVIWSTLMINAPWRVALKALQVVEVLKIKISWGCLSCNHGNLRWPYLVHAWRVKLVFDQTLLVWWIFRKVMKRLWIQTCAVTCATLVSQLYIWWGMARHGFLWFCSCHTSDSVVCMHAKPSQATPHQGIQQTADHTPHVELPLNCVTAQIGFMAPFLWPHTVLYGTLETTLRLLCSEREYKWPLFSSCLLQMLFCLHVHSSSHTSHPNLKKGNPF